MTRPASAHAARGTQAAVSVVLVDDHPMWRETLRRTLEGRKAGRVVGEASDGLEAVGVAAETRPDVVVMDIDLPRLNGIEATRRIVAENPGTRVLMLSSTDERSKVLEAIRAGASGYLLKTAASAELFDAVERIHGGDMVFPPALVAVVVAELRRLPAAPGGTDRVAVAAPNGGSPPDADRILATVVFTDIVDSTHHLSRLGDRAWRDLLARHDAVAHTQVEGHGGRVVDAAGDGTMSVFDAPARGVECVASMRRDLDRLRIRIRAGIHAGEVERSGPLIRGIAVHVAARILAKAAADETLVSTTVKDLAAGACLRFGDRGHHTLKGIEGRWRLWAVEASPDLHRP